MVALGAILPRWGSVVTAASSHLNVDENAAPERLLGVKLLTVPTPDGKLRPADLDVYAGDRGDPHRAQPLAISIAQPTELGTAYSLGELRELCSRAHELGMAVHMDGARLANAAVALGASLRQMTTDAGVDVLSLGATKNGGMVGECVVILHADAGRGTEFVRKYTGQLASKMRFVSAQLVALFGTELWRSNAANANARAAQLRRGIERVIDAHPDAGIRLTQRSDTNAVFVVLPARIREPLRARFGFYDWDARGGEVRLMCSFDTSEQIVDEFTAALAAAAGD